MARSLLTSGSQTTTPGTDHALHTWDAPSGGASYVLVLDCAALENGETLEVFVERECRANVDPRREEARYGVAAHEGNGTITTPVFGAAETVELRVGIVQTGGSGRAIPWAIERVA